METIIKRKLQQANVFHDVLCLEQRERNGYKYEKELFLNKKIPGINQLLTDYIDAYNSEPQIVPNYQVKWNSLLQEQTLGEYIPKLVNGEITTEEFTLMEDESIRQFQKESR